MIFHIAIILLWLAFWGALALLLGHPWPLAVGFIGVLQIALPNPPE